MAALNLRLDEPGDDHLQDEMFPILSDALEPGSGITLESAARKISDLLPDGDPHSQEASTFCDLCIQIAMQIPYTHAKMADLVAFVQLVLDLASDKNAVVKNPSRRYCAMGLPAADQDASWAPPLKEQERAKCVSFYTFEALLYKRCILEGATLPVQLLREVLEGPQHKPGDLLTRDIQSMAATQIILIMGDQILFKLLNHPTNDLGHWFAGPLYGKDRDPYSIDRWHFWQDAFRAIAAGKWDGGEKASISGETKELAIRAADTMDAIEKEVGPSTRQPQTGEIKDSDKSICRRIREFF